MNESRNFIIFGPGRCGSHWVRSLVDRLLSETWFDLIDVHLHRTNWTYHTHKFEKIDQVSSEMREGTTLVICTRKNIFNQAISHEVANATQEWHNYTDKIIEPFTVDPKDFLDIITHLYKWKERTILDKHLKNWYLVKEIVFEDLLNSSLPEKYIASQLNLYYNKKNFDNLTDKHRNVNTRNYQKLILNWNELVSVYNQFILKQSQNNSG